MDRSVFVQAFLVHDSVVVSSAPNYSQLTDANGFVKNWEFQFEGLKKSRIFPKMLHFGKSSRNLIKLGDGDDLEYAEGNKYGNVVKNSDESTSLAYINDDTVMLSQFYQIPDFCESLSEINTNYYSAICLATDDFVYSESLYLEPPREENGVYIIQGKKHPLFRIELRYDYDDILTIYTPRIYKMTETRTERRHTSFNLELYGPSQYLKPEPEVTKNTEFSKNGNIKTKATKKQQKRKAVEKRRTVHNRYNFYL